jgi:hypothetical protein
MPFVSVPATSAMGRFDLCICGGEMMVDSSQSLLCCRSCGLITELVGVIFDESQLFCQEGQKAKSGSFNPNRHFQFWWTRILALEPLEEIGDKSDPQNTRGEKLIASMHEIVRRDRKVLQRLTVSDVRAMLHELEMPYFNKNASLILKQLTNIEPPRVSEALSARVENLFTKAAEASERLRRPNRVNRNYYPYYIRRIIENIVPESDYETRRILFYIYVQSKDTVEADDEDWRQICEELPGELTYTPTDRDLGNRYAPRT